MHLTLLTAFLFLSISPALAQTNKVRAWGNQHGHGHMIVTTSRKGQVTTEFKLVQLNTGAYSMHRVDYRRSGAKTVSTTHNDLQRQLGVERATVINPDGKIRGWRQETLETAGLWRVTSSTQRPHGRRVYTSRVGDLIQPQITALIGLANSLQQPVEWQPRAGARVVVKPNADFDTILRAVSCFARSAPHSE